MTMKYCSRAAVEAPSADGGARTHSVGLGVERMSIGLPPRIRRRTPTATHCKHARNSGVSAGETKCERSGANAWKRCAKVNRSVRGRYREVFASPGWRLMMQRITGPYNPEWQAASPPRGEAPPRRFSSTLWKPRSKQIVHLRLESARPIPCSESSSGFGVATMWQREVSRETSPKPSMAKRIRACVLRQIGMIGNTLDRARTPTRASICATACAT